MKYRLTIRRTRCDVGTVTVEAETAAKARLKYLYPSIDDDVIFDDEIEWEEDNVHYDVVPLRWVK